MPNPTPRRRPGARRGDATFGPRPGVRPGFRGSIPEQGPQGRRPVFGRIPESGRQGRRPVFGGVPEQGRQGQRPSPEEVARLQKAMNDNKRKAWRVRTQARVDKYGWQGYQQRFGDDARQKKPAWLKRSPAAARGTGRGRGGTA